MTSVHPSGTTEENQSLFPTFSREKDFVLSQEGTTTGPNHQKKLISAIICVICATYCGVAIGFCVVPGYSTGGIVAYISVQLILVAAMCATEWVYDPPKDRHDRFLNEIDEIVHKHCQSFACRFCGFVIAFSLTSIVPGLIWMNTKQRPVGPMLCLAFGACFSVLAEAYIAARLFHLHSLFVYGSLLGFDALFESFAATGKFDRDHFLLEIRTGFKDKGDDAQGTKWFLGDVQVVTTYRRTVACLSLFFLVAVICYAVLLAVRPSCNLAEESFFIMIQFVRFALVLAWVMIWDALGVRPGYAKSQKWFQISHPEKWKDIGAFIGEEAGEEIFSKFKFVGGGCLGLCFSLTNVGLLATAIYSLVEVVSLRGALNC